MVLKLTMCLCVYEPSFQKVKEDIISVCSLHVTYKTLWTVQILTAVEVPG